MDGQTIAERTPTENYLHEFRSKIDEDIKFAEEVLSKKETPRFIREMAIVRTKLQEAKMWAGKCLEVEGAPFPEELRDEAK